MIPLPFRRIWIEDQAPRHCPRAGSKPHHRLRRWSGFDAARVKCGGGIKRRGRRRCVHTANRLIALRGSIPVYLCPFSAALPGLDPWRDERMGERWPSGFKWHTWNRSKQPPVPATKSLIHTAWIRVHAHLLLVITVYEKPTPAFYKREWENNIFRQWTPEKRTSSICYYVQFKVKKPWRFIILSAFEFFPFMDRIEPLLFQCWSTVYDAGPTLNQQWLNVSCLLVCFHQGVFHQERYNR